MSNRAQIQDGKVKGPPPVGRMWLKGLKNSVTRPEGAAVAFAKYVNEINVPTDVAKTEPALQALKTLNIPVPATASSASAASKFLSPTNGIGGCDSQPFILPS